MPQSASAGDGPEQPWIERMLGESWQPTIAGYGGGVMALLCIVLGYVMHLDQLIVTGLGILATSVAIVGQLSRSQAASTRAHEESLALLAAREQAHAANEAKIAEVQRQLDAQRRPPA